MTHRTTNRSIETIVAIGEHLLKNKLQGLPSAGVEAATIDLEVERTIALVRIADALERMVQQNEEALIRTQPPVGISADDLHELKGGR